MNAALKQADVQIAILEEHIASLKQVMATEYCVLLF
jgi:hypothetical protein